MQLFLFDNPNPLPLEMGLGDEVFELVKRGQVHMADCPGSGGLIKKQFEQNDCLSVI
jgi:hypothetical protein